jgi:hypothetical protein
MKRVMDWACTLCALAFFAISQFFDLWPYLLLVAGCVAALIWNQWEPVHITDSEPFDRRWRPKGEQ